MDLELLVLRSVAPTGHSTYLVSGFYKHVAPLGQYLGCIVRWAMNINQT